MQVCHIRTGCIVSLQTAVDPCSQVRLSKDTDHAEDLQSPHHFSLLLGLLRLRKLLGLPIGVPLSVIATRVTPAGSVVGQDVTCCGFQRFLKLSTICLLTVPLNLLGVTKGCLSIGLIVP